MSEETRKFDDKVNEFVRPFMSYLAYKLRDDVGFAPTKIRTTVFIHGTEGLHMVETEMPIDLEEYEKFYQEYISRDVIQQAQDVIESQKRIDAESE